MPIYEYECTSCGDITEILWAKFDGGPPTQKCKECGQEAKKITSTVMHANKKKGRP